MICSALAFQVYLPISTFIHLLLLDCSLSALFHYIQLDIVMEMLAIMSKYPSPMGD